MAVANLDLEIFNSLFCEKNMEIASLMLRFSSIFRNPTNV